MKIIINHLTIFIGPAILKYDRRRVTISREIMTHCMYTNIKKSKLNYNIDIKKTTKDIYC